MQTPEEMFPEDGDIATSCEVGLDELAVDWETAANWGTFPKVKN